jgi:hypothetical protein
MSLRLDRIDELKKSLMPKVKGMMIEEDVHALILILKDLAIEVEWLEKEFT